MLHQGMRQERWELDNWLLYALIVAAIAIGWWLGRRDRSKAPETLGPNYYQGVNYLLNDQPDRAVAAFIEDLAVSPDTLETHLAMGSLLRRRGEVEKAVSVHENILRHAVLERSTMLSVQLELARDYMQAGLLDRAEATVESLVDEPGQIRTEALSILLEVYEREKEWDKAIAAAGEIRSVEPNLPHRVSHYYCELAEVGLGGGDADLALRCLRQARDHDATNARVLLLEGRAELERGHHDKARHPLTAILEVDPRRVPESLDLLRAAFADGPAQELEAYLEQCLERVPATSLVLALAEQKRETLGDVGVAKFIADYLKRNPTIRGLTQLIDLHIDNTSGAARENLSILRSFTEALVVDKPTYRCGECGFAGKSLHWHCPSCRQWGTTEPIFGLEGE